MKALKGTLLAAAVAVMTVASLAGPAHAARTGHAYGRERGIVLANGAATRAGHVLPLLYHGGPVMRVNTTYAIYWVPSGSTMASNYKTTINRYFTDVSADSGKTSNVYFTETQYTDTTGAIAYSSTFGGAIVDTNPFPANGCSVYSGVTRCLTDAQISAEVRKVVNAHGLPSDGTHAYFMFTPKGVGGCFAATGNTCAFTYYCAYHSNLNNLLYANMPYANTKPAACDSGESPNGNDADATLNVTSHEHREMINDPYGTAWWDKRGYEGSDKCAWNFGASLGTAANGSLYNQLINGHQYYLQQEWSNAKSGCVLRGL
ncbi:MAG: hypothetical protein QOG88_218 [Actinomycetota bacterium]|nr:hypothetical protein [Actinomycetota bacterium]